MQWRVSFTLASDNLAQLLTQSFRGEIKLNELTLLKSGIIAFQICLYRLAKLVGGTNPFSGQDGKHSG